MADKVYSNGIFFNRKHPRQPDFVLGSLTIMKDKFPEWLEAQEADGNGYVRLQILNGREDKPYMIIDNYKPIAKTETVTTADIVYPDEEINADDIPY